MSWQTGQERSFTELEAISSLSEAENTPSRTIKQEENLLFPLAAVTSSLSYFHFDLSSFLLAADWRKVFGIMVSILP